MPSFSQICKGEQVSIEQVLKFATELFTDNQNTVPALDARVMLCSVLDKPWSYLFTWPEKHLSELELEQFSGYVDRRLTGEPVAYIVGEREFWSLPLKVAPSTLIPRPDTERLVELALDKIPQQPCSILDLGTGTGAIALAIASELPKHNIYAVDMMAEACDLARLNAKDLGFSNVQVKQSNWFEDVDKNTEYACIVSNPPYIDPKDPHLVEGDVRFEPSSALVAEDNGLADIKIIAEQSRHVLAENGWLLIEHGFEQGEAVREILDKYGYQAVSTEKDYADLDRVTIGCHLTNN